MKTRIAPKRTFFFKSQTDATKEYKVERFRDGNVFCTCPGFLYRRACRHADRMKQCA